MVIRIDCREIKLIEELRRLISVEVIFKEIEIVTENLLLGDIKIEVHDHVVLFERKTIDDLLASIKDGRYDEQSYRLQSLKEKVYYIVEGKVKRCQQIVYSSVLSLDYFKGFSVLKTDDLKETANMILYFFLKLRREEKKCRYSKSEEKNEESTVDKYPSLIQKKKNDNITVNNFAEIVLCQIPNVNHTYASVIMSKYDNNLMKLMEELKKDPNCLNELTYKTNTNKVRKISKTCLENIVKFLNK